MVTAAVEVAIIGWFVSSTISKLMDKALSYYKGQKSWQSGMKAELDRLQRFRPQIEALVYAAERGDLPIDRNPPLKEWLGQLRDAVEEADNVLDELEYRHLKEEKMIVKFVKRVSQQDDLLKRLREIVKTFNDLVTGLDTFAQVLSRLDGCIATNVRGYMDRETGSLFTETELFGREKEKQKVIRWLHCSDTKRISVFSIVGVGGVGKTALAQCLFDHKEVECFETKIWVCVSNTFEEKDILTKILESLTKRKQEFDTLDAAQRTLMEKLLSKKFLLVLDDVWNDKERSKWDKLMAPLRHGKVGCKILLTTRMDSVAHLVAKVVGGPKMFLNLNGLEERENMLLFEKYAFVDFDPKNYPRLLSIGNEIARKLRGIPLAVKTIGGMLNNKLEDEHWSKVLEGGALNSDEGTDGIKAAIRLSYDHLPLELKPCFRYCSLFPQDHEFNREQLVDMWISVGLVPHDEKRQEELGNDFFEILVQKSFFQPKASYYIMHDLLHELAQILSTNECLRVVTNNPIQIPQNIRHLSLTTDDIIVLKNLEELKYLRTLLLYCDIEDVELGGIIGNVLKGFKTLRHLDLSLKHPCDFPESIGNLVHLRCLSITKTKIRKLSPCVSTLYHLQILKVKLFFLNSKVSIPSDICNLSKLRKLDLGRNLITEVPHIGKLTSLQCLKGYRVKEELGYDISELEMMSELRELMIMDLENVKRIEKAYKAKLSLKQHLHYVALMWNRGSEIWTRGFTGESNESDKEVADCLEPHPKVTHLILCGYRSRNPPSWLDARIHQNLTTIELFDCNYLERLPPLGQLPYLKSLTLRDIRALKKIGLEFYGSCRSDNTFPALETLELIELTQLNEWAEDARCDKWFPRLRRLEVCGSPQLENFPPIPASLKTLILMFLGITTLPKFKQQNEGSSTIQGLRFLSHVSIIECSKLVSLNSGFFSYPEQLVSVEELEIWDCSELVRLPSEGFRDLISLKSLRIEGCKELLLMPMLLPKNFFPPSVQRVMLISCGDLVASLPQLLPNLCLISFLKVGHCPKLISLPSENVLRHLISLQELELNNCEGLKLLGGLAVISSLKILVIKKCPMLAIGSPSDSVEESSRNRLSMALDKLDIDRPELLLVVPLRNLHLTKSVNIANIHSMSALPERWLLQNEASLQIMDLHGLASVETFPDGLQSLTSLRVLSLINFFGLTRLPKLPTSLEVLDVGGCSEEFAERLKDGGSDYDKVRHLDVRVFRVGAHHILD
ncbi:hypothetical protein LUZ63_000378 [Rhynchospora breviuscula]|uniref:Uncharacterized protein n=1 Tax=Rhynchospora breviuscula TaxID=2022672 RepID=A0A9Q0CUU1_9POAL|nr:hypothetical protein LUZ63_000378 [Rhynchospora breviuscula]